MSTFVMVGIMIVPVLATVIIGFSIDRWLKKRSPERGHLLDKYLNEER